MRQMLIQVIQLLQVELDLHASQVKANNLEKHCNALVGEKEQMADQHAREVGDFATFWDFIGFIWIVF